MAITYRPIITVLPSAILVAAFLLGVWACGGKTSPKESASFWSGEADTSWYSGERDEFIINTADGLAGLAELVNKAGVHFKGKSVKLGRSIVINDTANWRSWADNPPARQWTGIGTHRHRFRGTFDGNGHTISGVYINDAKSYAVGGLFNTVAADATIMNLGLTASYIRGRKTVGGLVRINEGTIVNSYSAAVVVAEEKEAGGLVGVNRRGRIIGCYATGAVSGKEYVGGLVGSSGERGGVISNSYSTGAVRGDSYVGGLVGYSVDNTVNACYTISTVTATGRGDRQVEPLAFPGRMAANSFFDCETGGLKIGRLSGFCGTTAQMKQKGTFNGWDFNRIVREKRVFINWDFNTIWGMDSAINNGYPHLRGTLGGSAVGAAEVLEAVRENTEHAEWTISTAAELAALAEIVNRTWGGIPEAYNFAGKTIRLTKNIDLSEYDNWVPIGGFRKFEGLHCPDVYAFSGTFDGGGFVISNLTVNRPDISYQGLFGYIVNATIKNVRLEGVNIRGRTSAGGVAGYVCDSSAVIDCRSSADTAGLTPGAAADRPLPVPCRGIAAGLGHSKERLLLAIEVLLKYEFRDFFVGRGRYYCETSGVRMKEIIDREPGVVDSLLCVVKRMDGGDAMLKRIVRWCDADKIIKAMADKCDDAGIYGEEFLELLSKVPMTRPVWASIIDTTMQDVYSLSSSQMGEVVNKTGTYLSGLRAGDMAAFERTLSAIINRRIREGLPREE